MDPLTLQNVPDWPVFLVALGMALAWHFRGLLAAMADHTSVSAFRYRRRR
jgi:hypothetical protein